VISEQNFERELSEGGVSPRVTGDVASGVYFIDKSFIAKAGALLVATDVLPPGLAISRPGVLNTVTIRVGTAPTGAALNVTVKRNGVSVATPTIAASGTSGSVTGLNIAVAAGDVFTVDITQVGSTVAGSDLAVDLSS
jgi:hypothetical protein